MKNISREITLTISRIDRRHIQLAWLILTISMLVIGGGAPGGGAGEGGGTGG